MDVLTKEFIVPAMRNEMLVWKSNILREVRDAVVAAEERISFLENKIGDKDTDKEAEEDQTAKG